MTEQKIIDKEQLNWQEEEAARLDYQSVFDDGSGEEEQADSEQLPNDVVKEKVEIDVSALMRERDRMWKLRLRKARDHAFSQGFESGKMEGIKEARAEIDSKLATLREAFEKAHDEWRKRQEFLDPGILDLIFDISESILEIPVENPEIRKKLDRELGDLLRQIDEKSRPTVWVSESDYEYVGKLKEERAPHATININVSDECNPGEFKIDTDRESVIHNFRIMLRDFKDKLSLPRWK